MSHPLLLGGGVLLLMLLGCGFVMMTQMQRQGRIAERIRRIHGEPVGRNSGAAESEAIRLASLRAISGLGQMILRRGLLSASTLADLEQNLAAAGVRGQNGVALFIGTKILLLAALPLVTLVLTGNLNLPAILRMGLPVCAGVVGLVGPDFLIGRFRKRYLKRLERGLPDALDMMVICAQAGVGLGPAIVRVGTELHHAHPETAYEFAVTAQELQMLADSRVALTNLGKRTGLDSFKRLGATLVQTIQYGTGLSDALRVLSGEIRQEMLNRFEAKAARLPVLMTLPTVGCILPCVFMIGGGPAMIQVMKTFSH
jgi:tight adherence protein C